MSGRGDWLAVCQCSNCGNRYFKINTGTIRRGTTTSCGCRRDQYEKMKGINSANFTGYKEISGTWWGNTKWVAAKRSLIFALTIEEAWNLYEKQGKKCALTGLPIIFGMLSTSENDITTASLDRIDSEKGYTLDNVQWVHKDVNIMKNIFSQSYFVNMCRLVDSNNKE